MASIPWCYPCGDVTQHGVLQAPLGSLPSGPAPQNQPTLPVLSCSCPGAGSPAQLPPTLPMVPRSTMQSPLWSQQWQVHVLAIFFATSSLCIS